MKVAFNNAITRRNSSGVIDVASSSWVGRGSRNAPQSCLVNERFKNRDAGSVYDRFAERGRMMPDGVQYVTSWVETNHDRCFQVMECDDDSLLHEWADNWRDLVDFEFVPIITGAEMAEAMRLR